MTRDLLSERPRLARGIGFGAVGGKWKSHHRARHGVLLHERHQSVHGEAFTGSADEGREGLSNQLGFVGKGEADALLSPVHP